MTTEDFLKQARALALGGVSEFRETILFLIQIAERDLAAGASDKPTFQRDWYKAKRSLLDFFDMKFDTAKNTDEEEFKKSAKVIWKSVIQV